MRNVVLFWDKICFITLVGHGTNGSYFTFNRAF